MNLGYRLIVGFPAFLLGVVVTLGVIGVGLSYIAPNESTEWHEEIVVPSTFSEPLFPMLIMIIATIFLGIAYVLLRPCGGALHEW